MNFVDPSGFEKVDWGPQWGPGFEPTPGCCYYDEKGNPIGITLEYLLAFPGNQSPAYGPVPGAYFPTPSVPPIAPMRFTPAMDGGTAGLSGASANSTARQGESSLLLLAEDVNRYADYAELVLKMPGSGSVLGTVKTQPVTVFWKTTPVKGKILVYRYMEQGTHRNFPFIASTRTAERALTGLKYVGALTGGTSIGAYRAEAQQAREVGDRATAAVNEMAAGIALLGVFAPPLLSLVLDELAADITDPLFLFRSGFPPCPNCHSLAWPLTLSRSNQRLDRLYFEVHRK
jgi:hypothetical protein